MDKAMPVEAHAALMFWQKPGCQGNRQQLRWLQQQGVDAVVENLRLADGTLWPIPIVLDVPDGVAEKLAPGQKVALRDGELRVEKVATTPDDPARAVLEGLGPLAFTPDVIHCFDWTTGLIPLVQNLEYANRDRRRRLQPG